MLPESFWMVPAVRILVRRPRRDEIKEKKVNPAARQTMKTIYIVTSGSYSEYGINSVFSTRELAQAAADAYGDAEVEEHELDPEVPNFAPKGHRGFSVSMIEDGVLRGVWNIGSTSPIDVDPKFTYLRDDRKICILFRLYARDKDHAVKIANERRTGLILSGEIERQHDEFQKKTSPNRS